jgi:hypothetical protein
MEIKGNPQKNELALETNTAYKSNLNDNLKTTTRTVSIKIKSKRND